MCGGSGLWFDIEDVLQILIFPSGKLLPVASRSGFQGHHAIAYPKHYFFVLGRERGGGGITHACTALVTDFSGASIE